MLVSTFWTLPRSGQFKTSLLRLGNPLGLFFSNPQMNFGVSWRVTTSSLLGGKSSPPPFPKPQTHVRFPPGKVWFSTLSFRVFSLPKKPPVLKTPNRPFFFQGVLGLTAEEPSAIFPHLGPV